MFYVFDLDGTLADCRHRLPLILEQEPKDWDKFFELCPLDKPILPLVRVLQSLAIKDHTIEIWSGRPERTRYATEDWCRRHGIFFDALLLREDDDRRNDDALKMEWLDRLHETEWPDCVFEDRSRIVHAWRAR